MGSLYVLGNQQGLASIGSTKTGSMLEFENFYAPLANGEVMGEALRQWWNSTMLQYETSIYQQYYRSWFYGMVLTGDPTLLTDYNGYIEAYDASMVIRYSLQMEPGPVTPLPWGAARQYLADTSGDGVVTAYDSALILQYHVGIIDEFPQP
jgi:hypothetical protein